MLNGDVGWAHCAAPIAPRHSDPRDSILLDLFHALRARFFRVGRNLDSFQNVPLPPVKKETADWRNHGSFDRQTLLCAVFRPIRTTLQTTI